MTLSRNNLVALVCGIALVILVFILLGVVSTKIMDDSSERLSVGATVFPLADMVREVAGVDADVELILDPGASPHTFELSPNKAVELANVELVFSIGLGLDDWASGAASISGADVVELSKDVDINCNVECDPHYWLSIDNAVVMTRSIARELIALDPANADRYRDRADAYILELEAVNEFMLKLVDTAPKDIVVFHDSWDYFADSMGLNIVGTFEPAPGREPTPRQLAELQNVIKSNSITRVYREPQLSESALLPFTKDLNIDIFVLDPLGGVADRNSYINLMLFNAHAIAQ